MGNLVGSITVDFNTETSIVVRGDGKTGYDRVAVGDANLWPCYNRHQAATDTEIIAACAALIMALQEVQHRSRQRMAAEWAAAPAFDERAVGAAERTERDEDDTLGGHRDESPVYRAQMADAGRGAQVR